MEGGTKIPGGAAGSGDALSLSGPCSLQASAGRAASYRIGGAAGEIQKLEEAMEAAIKRVREAETKMTVLTTQLDSNHGRQKDILADRNETMDVRKRLDVEIQSLNDQITSKRDSVMKLQGSLQYRREDSLLEAIKRLESQLATHNYKMTEEKKIVQEIDRLKRSKKSLKDYNTLKEELESVMSRQRMLRNQRDASFHKVSSLRVKEEALKRETVDVRVQIDLLKKDIDGFYDQKRKLHADIKQAVQTAKATLHLRDLDRSHPKRPGQNPYKKAGSQALFQQHQQVNSGSPCDGPPNKSVVEGLPSVRRKERCEGRRSPGVTEIEQLCGTLSAYMHKLVGMPSPASASVASPVADPTVVQGSPQNEIYDGDKLLFLHRRRDELDPSDCAIAGTKGVGGARSKRKEKREKRRAQQKDKLLVHTADIVEQFFKLQLRPPSTVSDIGASLDALNHRRQQLSQPSQTRPTPTAVEPDSARSTDSPPPPPTLDSSSTRSPAPTFTTEVDHRDESAPAEEFGLVGATHNSTFGETSALHSESTVSSSGSVSSNEHVIATNDVGEPMACPEQQQPIVRCEEVSPPGGGDCLENGPILLHPTDTALTSGDIDLKVENLETIVFDETTASPSSSATETPMSEPVLPTPTDNGFVSAGNGVPEPQQSVLCDVDDFDVTMTPLGDGGVKCDGAHQSLTNGSGAPPNGRDDGHHVTNGPIVLQTTCASGSVAIKASQSELGSLLQCNGVAGTSSGGFGSCNGGVHGGVGVDYSLDAEWSTCEVTNGVDIDSTTKADYQL